MASINQQFNYDVGSFKVRPANNTLENQQGQSVLLPQLTFDLLMVLIENSPHVVTHKELIEKVWNHKHVSDETLQQRVKLLRQALNDNPTSPNYIITVRNKGYKLVASVKENRADDKLNRENKSSKLHRSIWKYISYFLLILVLLLLYVVVSNRYLNTQEINNYKEPDTFNPLLNNKVAILLVLKKNSPENNSLTKGLVSQLNLALSYVDNIIVIDTVAVSVFQSENKSPLQIGLELGVGSVILVEANEEDGQIQFKTQMLDLSSEEIRWSQSHESKFEEVYKVQTQIAEEITKSLQLNLNPLAQKMLAQPTVKMSAYSYVLKARQYLNRLQKEDNEIAIELCHKAIKIDSEYAEAYILLGFAKVFRYAHWDYSSSSIDEAIEVANKAIELKPNLSTGYYLLGLAYSYKDSTSSNNYIVKANEAFHKALEINPNDINAKTALTLTYIENNSFDSALKVMFETLIQYPNSTLTHLRIGSIFENLNYNELAIKWYEKALEIKPDYYRVMMNLSEIHESLGRYEQALTYVDKILNRYPNKSYELFQKGDIYFNLGQYKKSKEIYHRAMASLSDETQLEDGYYLDSYIYLSSIYRIEGRVIEAEKLLKRIKETISVQLEQNPELGFYMSDLALIAAMNDEDDQAVDWLNKAVDNGFISDDWIKQNPLFSKLKANGKLKPILTRIDQITHNFRLQVQDSGVLKDEVSTLD